MNAGRIKNAQEMGRGIKLLKDFPNGDNCLVAVVDRERKCEGFLKELFVPSGAVALLVISRGKFSN